MNIVLREKKPKSLGPLRTWVHSIFSQSQSLFFKKVTRITNIWWILAYKDPVQVVNRQTYSYTSIVSMLWGEKKNLQQSSNKIGTIKIDAHFNFPCACILICW